ncbi:uncharacterized protein LOC116955512 isoform X1 [Petromyzon marinus]|uniref:uncharacterized protein LOC116955512 isoform X1 n=2 Tax=Petromyzon marinus TaxID=7757 RepID=UPI003F723AEC
MEDETMEASVVVAAADGGETLRGRLLALTDGLPPRAQPGELASASGNYCQRFCEVLLEQAGRWKVTENALELMDVYESAIASLATARPLLSSACENVDLLLGRLALSCFELLLHLPESGVPGDTWGAFSTSVKESHERLVACGNMELHALCTVVEAGGAWDTPEMKAILEEKPLDADRVDAYLEVEGAPLLELRLKRLVALGWLPCALALARCCTRQAALCTATPFFRQMHLSLLCESTSSNQELMQEVEALDSSEAVEMICNLEAAGHVRTALVLCTAVLTRQLHRGDLKCSWELTLFWSKLQRQAETFDPNMFLESCRQLAALSKNVYHLFFLIKVIQSETQAVGSSMCVELCVRGLRMETKEEGHGITASLCKTVGCLLPDDLEVRRACQLTEFLLEPSVDAFYAVEALYTQPDQRYTEETGLIANSLRCELLLLLKMHWPFDPEFWDWKKLKSRCLILLGDTALEICSAEELREAIEVPVKVEKVEAAEASEEKPLISAEDDRISWREVLSNTSQHTRSNGLNGGRRQMRSLGGQRIATPIFHKCRLCRREVLGHRIVRHSQKHIVKGVLLCPLCPKEFRELQDGLWHVQMHVKRVRHMMQLQKKKLFSSERLSGDDDDDDGGDSSDNSSSSYGRPINHRRVRKSTGYGKDFITFSDPEGSDDETKDLSYLPDKANGAAEPARTEETFVCPANGCQKLFKYFKNMLAHAKMFHSEDEELIDALVQQQEARRRSCRFCKRKFETTDHQKDHMKIHRGPCPYVCIQADCGKRFRTAEEVSEHSLRHKHFRAVCSYGDCPERFSQRHLLYKHEAKHYQFGVFSCSVNVCDMFGVGPRKPISKLRVKQGDRSNGGGGGGGGDKAQSRRGRPRKAHSDLVMMLPENLEDGDVMVDPKMRNALDTIGTAQGFVKVKKKALKQFLCGINGCTRAYTWLRSLKQHIVMSHEEHKQVVTKERHLLPDTLRGEDGTAGMFGGGAASGALHALQKAQRERVRSRPLQRQMRIRTGCTHNRYAKWPAIYKNGKFMCSRCFSVFDNPKSLGGHLAHKKNCNPPFGKSGDSDENESNEAMAEEREESAFKSEDNEMVMMDTFNDDDDDGVDGSDGAVKEDLDDVPGECKRPLPSASAGFPDSRGDAQNVMAQGRTQAAGQEAAAISRMNIKQGTPRQANLLCSDAAEGGEFQALSGHAQQLTFVKTEDFSPAADADLSGTSQALDGSLESSSSDQPLVPYRPPPLERTDWSSNSSDSFIQPCDNPMHSSSPSAEVTDHFRQAYAVNSQVDPSINVDPYNQPYDGPVPGLLSSSDPPLPSFDGCAPTPAPYPYRAPFTGADGGVPERPLSSSYKPPFLSPEINLADSAYLFKPPPPDLNAEGMMGQYGDADGGAPPGFRAHVELVGAEAVEPGAFSTDLQPSGVYPTIQGGLFGEMSVSEILETVRQMDFDNPDGRAEANGAANASVWSGTNYDQHYWSPGAGDAGMGQPRFGFDDEFFPEFSDSVDAQVVKQPRKRKRSSDESDRPSKMKIRPYVCHISLCKYGALTRCALVNHYTKVHSYSKNDVAQLSHCQSTFTPFRCVMPDCKKSFTRNSNLRSHYRGCHKIDEVQLEKLCRESLNALAPPTLLPDSAAVGCSSEEMADEKPPPQLKILVPPPTTLATGLPQEDGAGPTCSTPVHHIVKVEPNEEHGADPGGLAPPHMTAPDMAPPLSPSMSGDRDPARKSGFMAEDERLKEAIKLERKWSSSLSELLQSKESPVVQEQTAAGSSGGGESSKGLSDKALQNFIKARINAKVKQKIKNKIKQKGIRCTLKWCKALFGTEEELQQHLAKHKDEPPVVKIMRLYKCNLIECGKSFTQLYKLIRHYSYNHHMTLEEVRSTIPTEYISEFRCDQPNCLGSFTRFSNLQRHQQSQHGINFEAPKKKPFACNFSGCNASFGVALNLQAHIKQKHLGGKDGGPRLSDSDGGVQISECEQSGTTDESEELSSSGDQCSLENAFKASKEETPDVPPASDVEHREHQKQQQHPQQQQNPQQQQHPQHPQQQHPQQQHPQHPQQQHPQQQQQQQHHPQQQHPQQQHPQQQQHHPQHQHPQKQQPQQQQQQQQNQQHQQQLQQPEKCVVTEAPPDVPSATTKSGGDDAAPQGPPPTAICPSLLKTELEMLKICKKDICKDQYPCMLKECAGVVRSQYSLMRHYRVVHKMPTTQLNFNYKKLVICRGYEYIWRKWNEGFLDKMQEGNTEPKPLEKPKQEGVWKEMQSQRVIKVEHDPDILHNGVRMLLEGDLEPSGIINRCGELIPIPQDSSSSFSTTTTFDVVNGSGTETMNFLSNVSGFSKSAPGSQNQLRAQTATKRVPAKRLDKKCILKGISVSDPKRRRGRPRKLPDQTDAAAVAGTTEATSEPPQVCEGAAQVTSEVQGEGESSKGEQQAETTPPPAALPPPPPAPEKRPAAVERERPLQQLLENVKPVGFESSFIKFLQNSQIHRQGGSGGGGGRGSRGGHKGMIWVKQADGRQKPLQATRRAHGVAPMRGMGAGPLHLRRSGPDAHRHPVLHPLENRRSSFEEVIVIPGKVSGHVKGLRLVLDKRLLQHTQLKVKQLLSLKPVVILERLQRNSDPRDSLLPVAVDLQA